MINLVAEVGSEYKNQWCSGDYSCCTRRRMRIAAAAKDSPTQVQVSFNLTPQGQLDFHKHVERGAISNAPQHVGFYYSVNPDCSSDGLVQTQLKIPPAHGSVIFVKSDGYTNFPSASPG